MDLTAARTLIASTRELADAFEASLPTLDGEIADRRAISSAEPIEFDPAREKPPFTPDPEGTRRQKDLVVVIMFGRLYAINIREGRGASRRDLRRIATAANYTDARAWNGWGKFATIRDEAGELELTETGHAWLTSAAEQQNFRLPSDLKVWRTDRTELGVSEPARY